MAAVLKKSKLSLFPSKTIGEAFDGYRYFAKREWKETPASGGRVYVDFTGWLKARTGFLGIFDLGENPSNRAIGIKFMVNLNGSYRAVMASRIEKKADGMLYNQPVEDLHDILKKIYENKEIKF